MIIIIIIIVVVCDMSSVNGWSLELVDKFTYLGSSVSSTETDIDSQLAKAWTAIDRLSVIWKSDLTNEMKHSFFQAAVVSILRYGCTTWMLTKHIEKKLEGNYTRMRRAILNKSWSCKAANHPSRKIKIRRTRHCWRSRDELISDALWWTPSHGRANAGRQAQT